MYKRYPIVYLPVSSHIYTYMYNEKLMGREGVKERERPEGGSKRVVCAMKSLELCNVNDLYIYT